jgi:tetratricopeptide (TPR) repeat protein
MAEAVVDEQAFDQLLGEASWLISHAQALADWGQEREAEAELAQAAAKEEQAAGWLVAAGRIAEAAVHWISAASCYQQVGDDARAAAIFRRALAGSLPETTRQEVRRFLEQCLARMRSPVPETPPRPAERREPAVAMAGS